MTSDADRLMLQTIAPICVEVAGLKNLQSMLSLSWIVIILPTTCKYARPRQRLQINQANSPVSQVIALKIRRPDSARPYLFPQLFVGLTYICASFIMLELRRATRKRRGDEDVTSQVQN